MAFKKVPFDVIDKEWNKVGHLKARISDTAELNSLLGALEDGNWLKHILKNRLDKDPENRILTAKENTDIKTLSSFVIQKS